VLSFGILLAIGRAGAHANLQLHQPLSGKSNHLLEQVGVPPLFSTSSRRSIIGLVIVGFPFFRLDVATQPYQGTDNGHPRLPASSYSAMWKGADGPRSANQLHHAQGHDLSLTLHLPFPRAVLRTG
jgi:hypothetical protein